MNYTTNFNLNKPEGTDLYNHLTVDNPNMDTIDAAMQANKLASVGAATELVSGTVHAITRSDSNQNIFKFKATGDFKAGDTITVDGVSVNAYTTNGQQLLNDAYVLSAEVLCILDNTSLWILVNKTPNASDVDYDNTGSGLTASTTQGAIDEVKTAIDNIPKVVVKHIVTTAPITIPAGDIGWLGSVEPTTINAVLLNYNDAGIGKLSPRIDKWYSTLRVVAYNPTNAAITIPSGFDIQYYCIQ